MVSITLSVPKEIHIKIKKHNEINWSGFIRNQINKKLEEIEKIEKNEKEITDFSLALQKKSRNERLKELKKRGLI